MYDLWCGNLVSDLSLMKKQSKRFDGCWRKFVHMSSNTTKIKARVDAW